MSGVNTAYVPVAGDVFALTGPLYSKQLTVVSGSGTQFVAQDGETYDTRSTNISIVSSANLAAVASVLASAGNTGSGAIVGVSVNAPGPAINLDLPYTGLNYATSNGQPCFISFNSPTAFQVVNAAKAVIASGAYSNPTTITFLGVSVRISGAPATADTFVVSPLA